MATYRVPVVMRGYAIVRYPDGKAVGDYLGGLPRDAEQEVLAHPAPTLCGSRMHSFSMALDGPAERVGGNVAPLPGSTPPRPLLLLRRLFAGG